MNTYNWSILSLDCKPQEEGMTDVVIVAHWSCNGSEPNSNTYVNVDGQTVHYPDYTASIYNTASFSQPDTKNFIPYADLTEEEVLKWMWNGGVDKKATELAVAQMIEEQKNPPVITPPLPWITG